MKAGICSKENNYKKLYDITGKKIFKWTVLERRENRHGNVAYWLCRCECGYETEVCGRTIKRGVSTQCIKCSRQENAVRTHGDCSKKKTKEYHIWRSIKNRCLNPNDKAYKNYGARGITICEDWKNSYENFLRDVGRKPFLEASLDRIDNSMGYEKSNVRWTDIKTQARNTRKQNLILKNEVIPISVLEKKVNITRSSLIKLIRRGLKMKDFEKYKKQKNVWMKNRFIQRFKDAPKLIDGKFDIT